MRRLEILSLFKTEQFGKFPDRKNISFRVFESGTLVFNETAIRKQITIYFTEDTSGYKADLLIYLPAKTEKPTPLILQIAFSPNCIAINDSGIKQEMI